ncbi:hypothetical protein B9Z55_011097 [Caenorhabditis nigoni]|uniref:F-box domain-containing protein n=1 Tax=Caenorhabditis nigoni TaxID=1611254 RepID=A0A2G5UJI5_9PELO|nr:hypothetical protein B9Z55_011097 [Caenorhabditis nigoni]
MANPRFPFRRLPDDLCLKVLETLDYYEMTAFSFVSKKAHSMIKSLRVPIEEVEIEMRNSTEIRLATSGFFDIYVALRSPENDGETTSLNDLPASVEVSKGDPENRYKIWSNQGMSFEQWIQHLLSIFKQEEHLYIIFRLGETRLAIPSFRNTFSKIKYLFVINHNYEDEPTDEDVLYAENVLRVFLPVVEKARLVRVPIRENFFVQHIGMANLKFLELESDQNVKFDDLLTLNVESLTIHRAYKISLRDLNRFFKLWMKGFFPRLNCFWIEMKMRTIPDWNVLMKGLKGKEVSDDGFKIFIVKNCHGVPAEIWPQYINNICSIGLLII